jgi:hyaluronan synthase
MLPTCTVIVPPAMKGDLVYVSNLLSIASSDFPQHKLQILAIDDGSKDDTCIGCKKSKDKLGDQITFSTT